MKLVTHNLTKIAFLALFIFGAMACSEEFLDQEPPLNVPNEDFLLTVDDFQSAMTGAYHQLQLADWYGRYMILIPDIMGEDVKQNASANRGAAWASYVGAATTTQSEHREFWAEIYEGINMVNAMINREFTPPASRQSDYELLMGQAYAYRGLAYFDLVRLFAQHYTYTADASHVGVPIVLEFDADRKPGRNTVAEVYEQIVSDLERGIDLMSATSDPGKLSREAAQALLSRVYLYMEDYENAESLATTVINSGLFDLIDSADYATQFLNGRSSEAIFEIAFDIADNPGGDHIGGMYKVTGYGDYLPAQDLLDLFDSMDVRITLFTEDSELAGSRYASADSIGRRVHKYPSSGSEIGTDHVPVIRLSEVYLNRAEARAKKANPDEIGALADLNQLRLQRNASATVFTALGQALVDEILLERRRELCFEGHRIFDITRNKQGLERNDCTASEEACSIAYPNDRFILAIPQDELDANSEMRQNDGYGV